MGYTKEGDFMLAGQNVAVDRLVKIIQAIKVEGMTGSLVVTRGEGISYELGTVVFLNGQVVQGRVGRHEGREALNWLLTWGKCCYTFVRSVTSDAYLRSKRQFSNSDTQVQSKIPHVRLVPLGQAQRLHAGRDKSAMERWPRGKREQLTQKEGKSLPRKAERMNEAVPFISRPLEEGLQILSEKGLSRMHRRVFLLVNGSRRVEDLMRLLKLSEHEMLALLYDLRDAGMISLPEPVLI
jgi:hypothetical protein